MAINLNCSSSIKEIAVQYMPFEVEFNGEVEAEKYFDPFLKEEHVKEETSK